MRNADVLAPMMFQHLLNPQHDMVEIASAEMLTAAVVALIEE
jgi:hypothetical protein